MISVNKIKLSKNDIKAVEKVLKKSWISSSGGEVKKFEKLVAKMINKKFASSVSSGTAALEIALKIINIKKNDEVIIPNFTIFSNAMAVIKMSAKPVLVDCDIENWNMNIDQIEKKITKNTKAIIATHIYGFPIEIDRIKKLCSKYNLKLIEDAAEMFGHKYKKKYCGFYGDISIFSFYANKHITTGEGGMILTNISNYKKKIFDYKNLCFGTNNRYNHYDLGWNYRFTNIQAALGVNQLKRIKSIIYRKKEIGGLYYKLLKNNKYIYIQPPVKDNLENVYWVVGILLKNKKYTANYFKNELKKKGIETRSFFWPMNKQAALKKLGFKFSGNFKNSEYLSKYGFYVPSGLDTSNSEIKFVSNQINQLCKRLFNASK